jgi:hypothetical protein
MLCKCDQSSLVEKERLYFYRELEFFFDRRELGVDSLDDCWRRHGCFLHTTCLCNTYDHEPWLYDITWLKSNMCLFFWWNRATGCIGSLLSPIVAFRQSSYNNQSAWCSRWFRTATTTKVNPATGDSQRVVYYLKTVLNLADRFSDDCLVL